MYRFDFAMFQKEASESWQCAFCSVKKEEFLISWYCTACKVGTFFRKKNPFQRLSFKILIARWGDRSAIKHFSNILRRIVETNAFSRFSRIFIFFKIACLEELFHSLLENGLRCRSSDNYFDYYDLQYYNHPPLFF